MSDRIERACTKCGSLLHHEDDCASSSRERVKARMEGAAAALEKRKLDANNYPEESDLHFDHARGALRQVVSGAELEPRVAANGVVGKWLSAEYLAEENAARERGLRLNGELHMRRREASRLPNADITSGTRAAQPTKDPCLTLCSPR